jgi:hypothetical protein
MWLTAPYQAWLKYLIRRSRAFQALFSSDLIPLVATAAAGPQTQKNGGAEAPPP